MKPKSIASVLRGMAFRDFVTAAEIAERERAANERLERIEAEDGKKAKEKALEAEREQKLLEAEAA